MKLFIPTSSDPTDPRIALLPEQAGKLNALGASLTIETGLGDTLKIPDQAYTDIGATITNRTNGIATADIILRLNEPTLKDIAQLKKGQIHISYLNPFFRPELYNAMAQQNISALSMEMIPRSTIAQKMDALSSQANLGGYIAVILAAETLDQALPMMMTPAGTLKPARVFIIGAGVAGLQAIATAKRLGARVDAFDTRPAVEEQIQSLGAKFLKIDLGETGQTDQGYAKELTPQQLQTQRQAMAKACAQSDIVITTAQLFGRKAPTLLTADMVAGMKPGSVIVDMAVETGGNVQGSILNQIAETNGIRIIGYGNLPGRLPHSASQMYGSNLLNLITHFWDKKNATFHLDQNDEIIQNALITHQGEITNNRFKKGA